MNSNKDNKKNSKGMVKSFIRLRPYSPNPNEAKPKLILYKNSEGGLVSDKAQEGWKFDHVFDEKSTNEEIFETIIENEWSALLTGHNMCIFTFGQTSSGKTFTMKGSNSQPGLVPLTLNRIFERLETKKDCCYKLFLSYYEVYNEGINDLLDSNKQKSNLEIREDKDGNVFIKNLKRMEIRNAKEATLIFGAGEQERSYASTKMNERSSRSHVIILIDVETRFKKNVTKTYYSKFLLADLAGSEGMKVNGKDDGARLKEGASINKSLCALKIVMKQLKDSRKDTYVSYRDSKLTRVQQPILSGNCKSNVICTLNCSEEHYSESLNTIQFGQCAGAIKYEVKQNVLEDDKITQNHEETIRMQEVINENSMLISELFTVTKVKESYGMQLENLQNNFNQLLKEKQYYMRHCEDLKLRQENQKDETSQLKESLSALSERKTTEVYGEFKEKFKQMESLQEEHRYKLDQYKTYIEEQQSHRTDYNRLNEFDPDEATKNLNKKNQAPNESNFWNKKNTQENDAINDNCSRISKGSMFSERLDSQTLDYIQKFNQDLKSKQTIDSKPIKSQSGITFNNHFHNDTYKNSSYTTNNLNVNTNTEMGTLSNIQNLEKLNNINIAKEGKLQTDHLIEENKLKQKILDLERDISVLRKQMDSKNDKIVTLENEKLLYNYTGSNVKRIKPNERSITPNKKTNQGFTINYQERKRIIESPNKWDLKKEIKCMDRKLKAAEIDIEKLVRSESNLRKDYYENLKKLRNIQSKQLESIQEEF